MGPPCLTGLGFGHPVEQVFPPLPKLLGPGGWRELPGLTTRGEGWGGRLYPFLFRNQTLQV